MANRNTKRAHKAGFASLKDWKNNGTKTIKGKVVDSGWGSTDNKNRSRKNYKRQPSIDQ